MNHQSYPKSTEQPFEQTNKNIYKYHSHGHQHRILWPNNVDWCNEMTFITDICSVRYYDLELNCFNSK